MVSAPSIFTEPVRRGTIPMIDFMVVVLPAPLRPTRVTSSPVRTSRSTPCSTWDSPYHACSLLTESSASGMLGAQICGDNGRILGDGLVVAFGEHLAAGENGDALGETRDHAQIVLHHQDRTVLGDPLDERRDAIHGLVAHAGRLRQGPGQRAESRRLVRAVGSDQRLDGSANYPQVDALDGDEPAKLLGQPAGLEDDLRFGHAAT